MVAFDYRQCINHIHLVLEENKNRRWQEVELIARIQESSGIKNSYRIKDVLRTLITTGKVYGLVQRRGSSHHIKHMPPDTDSVQGQKEALEQAQRDLSEANKLRETQTIAFQAKVDEIQGLFDTFKKEAATNAGRVMEVQLKMGARKVSTIKEIFHKEFRHLMDLCKMRKNIFIYGPTGCGKSHVCKQLAKANKLDFYFISCTAGMSEGNVGGRSLPSQPNQEELLETYKGLIKDKVDKGAAAILASALCSGFGYVISEFVKAYENGGLFLLDEMDAADSNVLLFINAALANGEVAIPNRPGNPYAKRHKDFVCVAAGNTPGTGGDREFSGRNKLDGATLDRFQIGKVKFEYDRELEKQLCLNKAGEFDEELAQLLWKVRDAIETHRLERSMSTRFFVDASESKVICEWSHFRILKSYFTGWRADEVRKVCDQVGINFSYLDL